MAKKRNAPVLRNNNEPAEKFRTVNRMNGIVTMVEYTSEDDIKAYELEPTFRELTGGGGGSGALEKHSIQINNNLGSPLTLYLPYVKDDVITSTLQIPLASKTVDAVFNNNVAIWASKAAYNAITVTGDISYEESGPDIYITATGDGTVSFS